MVRLDKIIELLKIQGKSKVELTNYLKLSRSVFADWQSGKNKSYEKHLLQIARFLNVPIDYIVDQDDNVKGESPLNSISEHINYIFIESCFGIVLSRG